MAKVEIRAESCKSCGYCVRFCSKSVLAVGREVNAKGYPYVVVAKPENCIGCALCAQVCPNAAIAALALALGIPAQHSSQIRAHILKLRGILILLKRNAITVDGQMHLRQNRHGKRLMPGQGQFLLGLVYALLAQTLGRAQKIPA